MIAKTSTMPQRDVSCGPTSLEANKIWIGDMTWLAEAIEARGGTAPSLNGHALYANELQSVYSALSMSQTYWCAHDLNPVTKWDIGTYPYDLDDIGAERPLQQRQCRSIVSSGNPLYGYDLRTAFWNTMQTEIALFDGEYSRISPVGATYRDIGQGGLAPSGLYLRSHQYDSSRGGIYGFEISGGSFDLSLSGGSFPVNVSEWETDTAYLIADVMSEHVVVEQRSAVMAAVPIPAELRQGAIRIDAIDALNAAKSVASHWSVDVETDALLGLRIDGIVPVMKVNDNYRVSDLGWTFQP